MTVTLPNLNELIADLDGRLLPFGWAKLLWRLKVTGAKSGRMPLMGLRKRWQGTLKGTAAAHGRHRGREDLPRRPGVREGELSWVLEDNEAVQHMIAAVGAVPYKTYRVYEKAI